MIFFLLVCLLNDDDDGYHLNCAFMLWMIWNLIGVYLHHVCSDNSFINLLDVPHLWVEQKSWSYDWWLYWLFLCSSPLEPLDLPHLLPRKRIRADDSSAPYSQAGSSRNSQSMSMDHILSVPYTTSSHVYTYPAAQQAMAWNGMMYPTFNTQLSAHGNIRSYQFS